MYAPHARSAAVTAAISWRGKQTSSELNHQRIDSYYGCDVFSLKTMKERLPKDIYNRFLKTIHRGEPLDQQVADVIAAAIKDWAIETALRTLRTGSSR